MATIRLVPSSYTVSNTSYLSVSNASNMYNNTDNTTYATVTDSRASTSSTYYFYLQGFNFDDIPSNAVINSFTVKIKIYESGNTTSTSYYMYLCNGTTATSDYASTMPSTSAQTITFDNVSSSWDTLSGYGSSFGIRVAMKRTSRNTTNYLYVYGAEILVDYTIPTTHTVTSTITGGTITSTNPVTVDNGDSTTVTFTGNSGYSFSSMTVGGSSVTPSLSGSTYSYTISSVIADTTVVITFQKNTCVVTSTITNGSITSTNPITVDEGDDTTITFKGDDGYIFSSMTVDGTSVTPTENTVSSSGTATPTYSTNYGTYSSYAFSQCYDGDTSTYFWSNEAQATGKYILISFDNPINLTAFSTYSSNSTDYPGSNNVLQVSSNGGTTWTDIGTFSDAQTTSFSGLTATNINAIRIYSASDNSKWLVLNTITMTYTAVSGSYTEYSYTISNIASAKTVIIIFEEQVVEPEDTDALYIKVNNTWTPVYVCYKKIDGVWTVITYQNEENKKLIYKGNIATADELTEIGSVSDDNVISLTSSDLSTGTYTLYYNDNDGKLNGYDAIGTVEV